MIGVHAPEQWQQSLVAEYELPEWLKRLKILEVILKKIVLSDLCNQPLFGISIEKAIQFAILDLPGWGVRSISLVVNVKVLHIINQRYHILSHHLLEVDTFCSIFIIFREPNNARLF